MAKKKKKLEELEKESLKNDFWTDQERAGKIMQDINDLSQDIKFFQEIEKENKDLKELYQLLDSGEELQQRINELDKKIKDKELETFLSGKYDKNNAILQIFSGAGGVDSQDWATMLLRMFQRYAEKKGFQTTVLDQSFGEGVGPEGRIGIKSAILEVKGKPAYGLLKKETGVHRLVRISPFSAKKLRHTSFALVEVLPQLQEKDKKELEIKPEHIKIESLKASGPGGQNVNKRETAVRIIHLPTNIVVGSQSERSQLMNRQKAMDILYAKLYQRQKEKEKAELKQIKGDNISASWGNQIRSYVLHPYKQVKDLRTNLEIKDPEYVLDGNLDEFIKQEIRIK
ncbi:MAG: peptide chain release factor 2 [Candidatus Pacebacteria bacterium]|nr:peptide chain release factor 2 [Candidatus Paceibacterota bacterium]